MESKVAGSGNQRIHSPTTSGANSNHPTASIKKKAPAPPAPKPAQVAEASKVKRPCTEHKFLTDVADVRDMEKGLLVLLKDFHEGKLQVFGKGCTFEQMDEVRDQQEKLSRLHFDLDAQQQVQNIDSDDAKDLTFRNLNKLVDSLDELNKAVHELKTETLSSTASNSPKLKKKMK
ncbi:coiled-coil domain-containing protein 28B-like [Watersipora subatra]|uniref:coiled-coil domain-containing protein 28B-like n=1 Tax=Watersipora subatra TaxID=2589382 RepID=UPI00355B4734